jgi:hypothetical protein
VRPRLINQGDTEALTRRPAPPPPRPRSPGCGRAAGGGPPNASALLAERAAATHRQALGRLPSPRKKDFGLALSPSIKDFGLAFCGLPPQPMQLLYNF